MHLYQCVGKGKKLEQIIRQCTELGLSSITPVMSRYTLSDVTKNWNVKSQRYRKVAEQAIQQSASPVMTKIEEPVRIQDIASRVDDLSRLLVFHQSLENSPATNLLPYQRPYRRSPSHYLPSSQSILDGTGRRRFQ